MTIPIIVTLEDAIKYLNEALNCDPVAVNQLITNRVNCNDTMANHPTVQCGKKESGDGHEVGMLGILNGLFGIREDGWGHISAILDEPGGKIIRFETTRRDPLEFI